MRQMVTAISDMPRHEISQQDESPNLAKYRQSVGGARFLEVMGAYLLKEDLDNASRDRHEEIVTKWAFEVNRSPGALLADLKWVNAIDEEDLRGIFTEASIPDTEWTQAVGTSHLRVIGRAKHQDSHLLLTSQERAEIAFDAYHAHYSVKELEEVLRGRNLLPPKRGAVSKPLEKGKLTGCHLMELLAGHVKGEGKDFDLSITPDAWAKPILVHKALWRLAQLMEKLYPTLTFQLAEEAKPDASTDHGNP